MRFNNHSALADRHAFLSPSKYHWVNYDEDKLDRVFMTAMTAARGSELHDYAHRAIKLGIKQRENGSTLSLYVNHAIGYRMTSEVPLYYSDNCFGHADTIGFNKNRLRIHDLKNGTAPTNMHQLEVYAALFCLEYGFLPFEIEIELRIYQNNDCRIYVADPDVIMHIMEKIKAFDRRINTLREEVLS